MGALYLNITNKTRVKGFINTNKSYALENVVRFMLILYIFKIRGVCDPGGHRGLQTRSFALVSVAKGGSIPPPSRQYIINNCKDMQEVVLFALY